MPSDDSVHTPVAIMDLYQFAVMPPYRGWKSGRLAIATRSVRNRRGLDGGQFLLAGIRLKAGMTDCELRHDQLTA